jgi:4-hydroxy-2-oxoheptanedioate aldolase
MNAIKDSIKAGRTVVGTAGAPNVDVSLLADAGFDFLLFDSQHSPREIKQLQPSIQAMRGKQTAPVVRVAATRYDKTDSSFEAMIYLVSGLVCSQ